MQIHSINSSLNRSPLASKPENSRGRIYPEQKSPSRSEFQRDRDRIIHSAAFRRLQHKTQVFVHNVSDHYRTRLTHTIEVAQIARSATRALGLDEDLAEAIALAHDLGHPPFGHAGEEALDRELAEYGGFNHNAQTLRIVIELENRYASFQGLNLTWEVLEGMAKHNGPIVGPNAPKVDAPKSIIKIANNYNLDPSNFAGPEAQVASLSDDIAYLNHDIDDGVRAKLLSLSTLKDFNLSGSILEEVERQYPKEKNTIILHETIRRLIDAMIVDLIDETKRRIEKLKPTSSKDISELGVPFVAFSEQMFKEISDLRNFLYHNMYKHSEVKKRAEEGAVIVSDLYRKYVSDPSKLPLHWAPIKGEKNKITSRRIADFIAGMTDRYAKRQHDLFQGNI